MRYTSIGFCLAVLALSGLSAHAADTDTSPPVDRVASLARAPEFAGKVEAALGQPTTTLYQAAIKGAPEDTWVYALAMLAKRDNMDSVPPVQRQIYSDYAGRVADARAKYQKKHKKADMSQMTMDQFVEPTEPERQAVLLVHAIHDPDYWFGRIDAGQAKLDPAAIQQSRDCVAALLDDVSAEDMASQLMAAITLPAGAGNDGGKADAASILQSLMGGDGNDEPSAHDLDRQAICGGKDIYAGERVLMKGIYKSEFIISVTKDKS